MKVVGITSQQEVFIGSKDRNFRINEFLIIEDSLQGDVIGEIVEAQTFNRYIPLDRGGDFVDDSVLSSLRALGYNIDEETIYIARLRFLEEANYPIETGSSVRIPTFSELKDIMVKSSLDEGLALGVIRNTDAMYDDMDEELKDIMYTFEQGHLKEQEDIPYIMDLRSMHQYPHIGVFGGSGSGKSFGLRVILEEIMNHQIPTLVLDPHFEMDFSTKASYLEDDAINYSNRFHTYQVGVDVGVKFQDLSTQDLKNLLSASSSLTDSMNNVVDILFKSRDSLSSFSSRLNMLIEAQELGSPDKIEARIQEAKNDEERKAWEKRLEVFETYSKICPHNSVRGILWRLKRLENEGIFSKDIRPIEEAMLNGKLVVIQGSTRILQVFSTYLLNSLYHKRRDYKDAQFRKFAEAEEYFPPFLIVTDEAHNFAPKAMDSPSKSILREISQEGRKYGSFLILATQRPNLLDETITAQLNSKFIFRTVRASDIDTIKEETDLTSEETKRLPYLRTGDVFVSSAAMGRTIYARIRAANTESPHTENPFDELKKNRESNLEDLYLMVKEHLPVMDSDMLHLGQVLDKKGFDFIGIEDLSNKMESLVDEGLIDKKDNFLGFQYVNKD